jgi:hypothetical protein
MGIAVKHVYRAKRGRLSKEPPNALRDREALD